MKGLKFLASCAAIGALTTICAVSSYAATATYVDGGTVDVTDCQDYIDAVGNKDLTLLVLDGDSVTNVAEGNILQINQGDKTILTGIKLDTTKLDAILEKEGVSSKRFEVRVGGMEKSTTYANGFISAYFTYSKSGSSSDYDDPDRLLGDVDGSGDINLDDAVILIAYDVDGDTDSIADVDTASAADTDESGDINLDDAVLLISYDVDGDDSVLGTKTIGERGEPCNP